MAKSPSDREDEKLLQVLPKRGLKSFLHNTCTDTFTDQNPPSFVRQTDLNPGEELQQRTRFTYNQSLPHQLLSSSHKDPNYLLLQRED